jgi:hypothetical protein
VGVDSLAAALFNDDTNLITGDRLAYAKPKPLKLVLGPNQGFKTTDPAAPEVEFLDVNHPFGVASWASGEVERTARFGHSGLSGVDVRRCPTMIVFVASACLVTVARQPHVRNLDLETFRLCSRRRQGRQRGINLSKPTPFVKQSDHEEGGFEDEHPPVE